MTDNKKIRVVSLFSGIGGFEEGIKNANIDFEVVFASEIDDFAKKSYSANFDSQHLFGDITEIKEEDIPDHDLLVGGFPCQAFSIAGQRQGFNDTRGTLFFDIARILKLKKPKYLVLENVKNLISHDNTNTIKVILQTLNNIGYSIDFTIINSMEAGVPQNRDRTYIVGIYNYKDEKFSKDTRSQKINKLKEELNNSPFKGFNFFSSLKYNNTNKYIENILIKNVEERYFLKNNNIELFLQENNINDISENQNKIVKLFDLPKEIHNDLERQRRVYSIKGISPTVLARSDSPKIMVQNNGIKRIRKVTPEENFYIQGFGKEFVKNIKNIGMSATQMYKQSGNAVSPPVITGIIDNLCSKYMNRNFEFIDLFSGLGGFRVAFENLGGKCVFSSDIDAYARETYQQNFGEYPKGDITKIDEKTIPDHDILCAGFPCQPFSIAGKRLGFEDTRGTLFFHVLRILKEKRPKAFFLENVAGISNHDNGNTIQVIEKSLKQLNYIVRYDTINSKDVGYPQNRNRWYCVGFNKDYFNMLNDEEYEFPFPKKRELKYTIDDCLDKNVPDEYNVTLIAKENINNYLPAFKENKRYSEENILIANEVRKSRCNFRCDGISPCLTAKMGTGGNNIPIIVSSMRKLTERECLRIMGFPDTYQIKKNNHQSYKQIGNSVVVPIIEDIGMEILNVLKK